MSATLDASSQGGRAPAIRSSLLRGSILLILLTCGATFGLQLLAARRTVDDLSRSLIDATADRIEEQLHRFFGPARNGLRIAREWGRSGLLPMAAPQHLNTLLMPFLEGNPLVSAVMVADSEGREYMLQRTPSGWLSRLVGIEAGDERSLHLRWSDRETLVEQWRRKLDYDPRTRPWFEGALALENPSSLHWTEPYAFFATKEPGITASTRWQETAGGEVVIAFDVLLSDVTAFTQGLEVSARGRALVLDEDGRVIGLPRDGRFATPEAVTKAVLDPVDQLDIPALASAFGKWLQISAGEGDVFSYDSQDEAWWGGFRQYPISSRRYLWIGVAVPESDLLGGVAQQREQFLAVTSVALLAAVLVALGLDRVIRRRFERTLRNARRVGQYSLVREIGSGGMGSVYRARHAMLRRPTAVKLLTAAEEEGAVERFEREVQITSELTHPNTVAIYDYGRTPEGVFYYAMEHLAGITLLALVERFGPAPAERVISILVQACGSLAEAHARGLVHRDVKPQNIMLCRRGGRHDVVKVLDFGLVKDLAARDELELTRVRAIPGSPLFLSPEAVKGADQVEPRSDLYALGAVGYFLLSGRTVFEGSNAWMVCLQHLQALPKPPSARVDAPTPADLERVIMDCLAKDPRNRPDDAEELARRLEACADAGHWTEDRARRWWSDHGAELADLVEPSEEPRDAAARSLSIDIGDRLRSDAELRD